MQIALLRGYYRKIWQRPREAHAEDHFGGDISCLRLERAGAEPQSAPLRPRRHVLATREHSGRHAGKSGASRSAEIYHCVWRRWPSDSPDGLQPGNGNLEILGSQSASVRPARSDARDVPGVESLQGRLAKDLELVRSWGIENGHLFLSLMAGGRYEFAPMGGTGRRRLQSQSGDRSRSVLVLPKRTARAWPCKRRSIAVNPGW